MRRLQLLLLTAIAGATTLLPASAQTTQTITVLYAGSLVTPMEGPIKTALRARGIDFAGEGGGSKKLANLIAGGLRNPDVFVSVDPVLVANLGSKVARATTFAGTSLGIGWSDRSSYAQLFADVAAGKKSLRDALAMPQLRIGRTDPKLDPKGAYTIRAMTIFAGAESERAILGDDENRAQVFPEEDLLTRIDTGEADIGFFYRTEATARGIHFLPLPGAAALTDTITYTLAIMRDAPHPDAAKAFETFLLTGEGKTLLEKAGITYLTPTIVTPKS